MKQHKNNFHINTIKLFIDINEYITKGLINPIYIGQCCNLHSLMEKIK